MSGEAIKRAKEAAWLVATDPATPGKNIPLETPEDHEVARACSDLMVERSVLAFLDPEDEGMVAACVKAIDNPHLRDDVRAVISVLRALAAESPNAK